MASLDVPAMVNYVIDTTGYSSLGYVGHSEGTIQMFAAGSSVHLNTDPDFQRALSSINLFVALAPVAYVSNLRSKLLVLLANSNLLPTLMDKGMVEFLPDGGVDTFAPEICHLIERGCDMFLMTICGPSLHLNASRIQVYVAKTPAGTSTVNMMHWMQGVLNPTFAKYDFGSAELNMAKYGQETPPLYDLSKMTLPTALFYGQHDYLADITDVERLIDELPADKIVLKSYLETYAHLDYTWAYDANVNVYAQATDILKEYAQKAKK